MKKDDYPVGLLSGGMSAEREISLRSGKNVKKALINLGYEVIDLDINDELLNDIRRNNIMCIYNILHGKYGEDGAIQGFFEVNGVSYTGSGVMSSSICMDKDITRKILMENSLPVAPGFVIEKNTIPESYNFDFPLILKPVLEGSSIDIELVNDQKAMEEYLKINLYKYNRILAEQFISGKELTVGIIGTDAPIVLPILELNPHNRFYDYDAKYTPGKTDFIIPAEIPEHTAQKVKEIALKAHKACHCFGVSRVDIMLDNKLNPYILEINTSPGMTDQSDLPAQAKAAGISIEELVEIILKSSYVRR